MRSKLSLLIAFAMLATVAVTAQESAAPSSEMRAQEAAAAKTQGNVPPQLIDPSELKILHQGVVSDVLGTRVDLGLERSPIGQAATSLPLWTFTDDGETGQILGTAPSTQTTTTVPVVVVPVVLRITQGGTTFVFDPTAADNGCLGTGNTGLSLLQQSPIFNNAPFTINGVNVGNTQYPDAIQRAEFWTTVNGGNYHVLLSASTGAALTISVNAHNSGSSTAAVFSLSGTQCGTNTTTNPHAKIAVINVNTIDSQIRSYITAHGITTGQFVFFALYNSVMSGGAANNVNLCCILGYHNALGSPGQTYGIGEFEGRDQTVFSGVADIAAQSHEVSEWVNDPGGANPTKAWGGIGQVSGCQGNFEVGDPLSGTLMPAVTMSNGFTYHPQELAFFSWFYHDVPSQGAGGKYSSNGTFGGDAKACPPGGTN